ncbi:hypothetical protein F511_46795 [Dorcoceras hygrometricum]|uniref:Retrotransposon gag domain-containing protein n=1 Tax=Dorcoceras hygrometricum TaxID=472368 RepID=A0A2Z6ZTP0_9LAMI|nr:hypothetical protein F511_46795 [Dorcoceras hygrometricum]
MTLKQEDLSVRDYVRKFERGCYFVPLIGGDAEEKLRHFVDGLRPTIKHDVRLAEPKDYRAAVDKVLRAEQDWKEIEEERQLKRQASQPRDQRQFKKQNFGPQRSQGQRPQYQKPPPSTTPKVDNKPECPKCHKNHAGEC